MNRFLIIFGTGNFEKSVVIITRISRLDHSQLQLNKFSGHEITFIFLTEKKLFIVALLRTDTSSQRWLGWATVWPQKTWAENWGLCPIFWRGELGPHLTQCAWAEAYLRYQMAS